MSGGLQARCCGKEAFDTEEAAQIRLDKIRRLGLRRKMPTRVVECSTGFWHLAGAGPADTGPAKTVRELVIERDEGCCSRCGERIVGHDYSLQHRKPRGSGGTPEKAINSPANLVLLCGSATTKCHGYVESHRTEAEALGYLISQHSKTDPAFVRVYQRHHGGFVLLSHDGAWSPALPAGGEAA